MSWKRTAQGGVGWGVSCLCWVLMWTIVAPALGVLLVLASLSGNLLLRLGVVLLAALFFGLYVLATWD